MEKQKKLNLRETLFVHLYLSCGSRTDAAREAGYRGDLGKRAYLLMQRDSVREAVERGRARLVAKAELKAEELLAGLLKIIRFDPRNCFDPKDPKKLRNIHDLDADTAYCIVSWDPGRNRFRAEDKRAAIQLAGEYLRLWMGAGDKHSDRLKEVIDAISAGPVKKGDTIQ